MHASQAPVYYYAHFAVLDWSRPAAHPRRQVQTNPPPEPIAQQNASHAALGAEQLDREQIRTSKSNSVWCVAGTARLISCPTRDADVVPCPSMPRAAQGHARAILGRVAGAPRLGCDREAKMCNATGSSSSMSHGSPVTLSTLLPRSREWKQVKRV